MTNGLMEIKQLYFTIWTLRISPPKHTVLQGTLGYILHTRRVYFTSFIQPYLSALVLLSHGLSCIYSSTTGPVKASAHCHNRTVHASDLREIGLCPSERERERE